MEMEMEYLENLEDGWDCTQEYSQKPHKDVLKVVRELLKYVDDVGEKPYLAPGPDGEVEIQWLESNVFCDIDVENDYVQLRWEENELYLYDEVRFENVNIEKLATKIKSKIKK